MTMATTTTATMASETGLLKPTREVPYDQMAGAAAPVTFPLPPLMEGTLLRTPVHVPEVGSEMATNVANHGDDDDSDDEEANIPLTEYHDNNKSDTIRGSIHVLRGTSRISGHVLVPPTEADGSARRAYWIQRKMSKTTYGWIRVGYVLRPYNTDNKNDSKSSNNDSSNSVANHVGSDSIPENDPNKRVKIRDGGDDSDDLLGNNRASLTVESLFKRVGGNEEQKAEWEVVPSADGADYEMVTVKVYERSKMEALRGRRMEDPMVELSVAQMIAQCKASGVDPEQYFVEGTIDVLSTERHIYRIVPYSKDGSLVDYVEGQRSLEEGVARHFFRQFLKSLQLFQALGICHRDLHLGNVTMRNGDAYVVGNSKSLRIPYAKDDTDVVTDVTQGTRRRLISPQGPCGQPSYMAPEILSSNVTFDGHSVDLWASAIMLFHMLFGKPPFVWAANDDPRFHAICVRGNLRSLVQTSTTSTSAEDVAGAGVSEEALDLLQGMLRLDPRDRLSLSQVMAHPWVTEGEDAAPSPMLRPPELDSSLTTTAEGAETGQE